MPWDVEKARERIKKHISRAPDIEETFDGFNAYRTKVTARTTAVKEGEFPRGLAVPVTGAHLYGRLLDVEPYLASDFGPETEDVHRQILQILDIQYKVWDSLVDNGGGFTVDFHGPRLHAVFADPDINMSDRVAQAVALAGKLSEASSEVAATLGRVSNTRFGIDTGVCLAMTTGRSHETDTLFLGAPANYAAKITEMSDAPGIYLSDRAQAAAGGAADPGYLHQASESLLAESRHLHRFEQVDEAVASVRSGDLKPASFSFFRPTPPLKSLHFADLTPSRTARLETSSLFADVDGYTAFVDQAIANGKQSLRTAVTGIHAIREELNDVLKDDFGGKCVRFIGDCIHGAMASGKTQDNPAACIEEALLCASAMRNSFDEVLKALPGLKSMDLAVGVDYGPSSMTRIGNRGEDSIRCAAGRCVSGAEKAQKSIDAGGISLGKGAAAIAPSVFNEGFREQARIPAYDDALNLLGIGASPAIEIIRSEPENRPWAHS